MNSSEREATAAAPPPPLVGASYSRFIPREELRSFAAWRPGSFGDTQDLAPAAWATAPVIAAPAHGGAGQRLAQMQPGLAGCLPPGPHPAQAAAAATPPEPASPPPTLGVLRAELRAALRAELQAELQPQVAAARTQGYQDGYRDGLVALESFKQSFASQTSAQIGQVLHALDSELGQLEQQMATSLARVATELARQVVRSELSVRPALVAQVAREAVNAVLASARQISVLVNPDDHALVASGCEDALLARGARLLAQAGIARGGCRVESDAGTVDARVAARWAQATQALGSGVVWDDEAAGEPRPGADA